MEQVDYITEEMPRLIYGFKRVLSITRFATAGTSPLALMKHRPSADILMLVTLIHDHTEKACLIDNAQKVGTAIKIPCTMNMPTKLLDPAAAAVVKRESSTKCCSSIANQIKTVSTIAR